MCPPVSQIELLGFDHVDIRVRDREKARRFFVEQLGLELLGNGPEHTFLLLGDQVLGLHDAKPGEPLNGVDHLALRVANWTNLRNRVRRARVEVRGEKERDDSRSLYLKGPDGLQVELVWRPDPSVHRCVATPVAPPTADPEDEEPPMPKPRPRRR
jgi:catechol 2,3-dioxygenase-like lactoylglutathione lyase family enzyme